MSNPLTALTALELAAAASPLQSALNNIANGDGSIASVTGNAVALQGEIMAILPTLQKIGITNIAAYLNDQLAKFVTDHATATLIAPATK